MTSLLRPNDVAKLLGVTTATIYNLVKAGRLPAVAFSTKPGRETVRFETAAVEEFIAEHRTKSRRTG